MTAFLLPSFLVEADGGRGDRIVGIAANAPEVRSTLGVFALMFHIVYAAPPTGLAPRQYRHFSRMYRTVSYFMCDMFGSKLSANTYLSCMNNCSITGLDTLSAQTVKHGDLKLQVSEPRVITYSSCTMCGIGSLAFKFTSGCGSQIRVSRH